MALTLLQLRTRVARTLQDPSFVYWSSAEIDDAINEALRAYVRETGCLRGTVVLENDATFDTDHATAFYTLPADTSMLAVKSVKIPGLSPLCHFTPSEWDRERTDWEDDTGQATHIHHGEYGHGVWRVWPKPSTAYTTAKALITKMPATLALDADTPEISEGDHDCLTSGAIAILQEKADEIEGRQMGADHAAKFASRIAQAHARAAINWDTAPRRVRSSYV